MVSKHCYESEELKLLRYLNDRMSLTFKEAKYYRNLEKGFEGEQKFEKWAANLSDDWLVLNDLLLEYNNTVFQIDSLALFQEKYYLFEVKNYEGDYFVKADKWYKRSGKEIKNPLIQLERCESSFRQLLQDLGFDAPIEAFVIFINPDFYLYQAPLDLPVIFPTQLNRFMDKLNMQSSKLHGKHSNKLRNKHSNLSESKHSKLAQQLVSMHLEESPYTRIPQYHYNQLEKGVTCVACHSFLTIFTDRTLICNECDYREKITSAVLRSVEEFRILFPNRKITTNAIYEWCKIIKSKKTIRKILSRNFKPVGHSASSHYLDC
jgi:hypothetical protein